MCWGKITSARRVSKGLREGLVITKHGLRNALIPIVTVIGLETGALLSGAVLTEPCFALPGMARPWSTPSSRAITGGAGLRGVQCARFVLANLIVDVSYAYLDPRIRLE